MCLLVLDAFAVFSLLSISSNGHISVLDGVMFGVAACTVSQWVMCTGASLTDASLSLAVDSEMVHRCLLK